MKSINKIIKSISLFLSESRIDVAHIVLVFIACFGIYLGWAPVQIIIAALIVWILLKNISGWLVSRWSIVFFILMSAAIIFKEESLTEQFGLGAILFLFISVIMISLEDRREKNEKRKK